MKILLIGAVLFSLSMCSKDEVEEEQVNCRCETVENMEAHRTVMNADGTQTTTKVREEEMDRTYDPTPECDKVGELSRKTEKIEHFDHEPPYYMEYVTIFTYECEPI